MRILKALIVTAMSLSVVGCLHAGRLPPEMLRTVQTIFQGNYSEFSQSVVSRVGSDQTCDVGCFNRIRWNFSQLEHVQFEVDWDESRISFLHGSPRNLTFDLDVTAPSPRQGRYKTLMTIGIQCSLRVLREGASEEGIHMWFAPSVPNRVTYIAENPLGLLTPVHPVDAVDCRIAGVEFLPGALSAPSSAALDALSEMSPKLWPTPGLIWVGLPPTESRN